ncbi:MAG: ComEC/Rec2 family competence protein [Vicinamibacterales bacterium]
MRRLVAFALVAGLVGVAGTGRAWGRQAADAPGAPLSPRVAGGLDIHHIVTGRGNATFFVLPDGTTMLFDAGGAGDGIPFTEPRPDGSRRPGEWIAAYVDRVLPAGAPRRLDYVVISHFHVDHMGGLADVAAALPVGTLIDRGWPAYDAPVPPPGINAPADYVALARRLASAGTRVERARVGVTSQVAPGAAGPGGAPFEARIVAANGEVWTGRGEATEQRFPTLPADAPAGARPTENESSIGLRVKLGAFDYYIGGDLTGVPDPGMEAWRDMETPIARAIGAVDARQMHHHGSISPENAFFLATTRARVVVIPAWAPSHPAPGPLKRLLTPSAYPDRGPRDVFVTLLREPTATVIGARVDQLKSRHGHVVIRVAPDGATYRVVVLDDERADAPVVATFGPYASE